MSSFLIGISFISITAVFVILGDFILKLAADAGQTWLSFFVVVGVALYAVSALLWFGAMRHITLGQGGVAYSMITLVALAVIGAVAFGERLGLREIAGIGCALTAMVLMVRIE